MRVQVAALVLATAVSTLPPVFAHAASSVSFGVGFFFGADFPLDRSEQTAITLKFSGIDENAFRVGYNVAF